MGELEERIRALENENAGLRRIADARLRALKITGGRYKKEKEASSRDSLTGLYNHREFGNRLMAELSEANRHGYEVYLLFLDIDHFKDYNDAKGHQEGDKALKWLAEVIKECVRAEDFACRYGGEEFTVILAGVAGDAAGNIAGRIKAGLREKDGLTVSIGISKSTPLQYGRGMSPEEWKNGLIHQSEELVSRGDCAMYAAKLSGGNRSCTYESALELAGVNERMASMLEFYNKLKLIKS